MIILIDWEKAEWAKKIKIYLNDETSIIGSGNGLYLAENFEDEEDQVDTFSILVEKIPIALSINNIKDVQIIEL